jgi:hypothetical protein
MSRPPLIYHTGTPVPQPPVEAVIVSPPAGIEVEAVEFKPVQYESDFYDIIEKTDNLHLFDQALEAQLNMQSILQKIDSALSIWASPEGQQLNSNLKGNLGSYTQVITSLRDTYRNVTSVLLDFQLLDSAQPNSLPLTAVDWAVNQLEWIQWQAIEAYWQGDKSAGSYAIACKDILQQYKKTLIRWQTSLAPITGTPDPGSVLPPVDPGAPTPPSTTSNKNILLIGAAGVALLYFLFNRK